MILRNIELNLRDICCYILFFIANLPIILKTNPTGTVYCENDLNQQLLN